MPDWSPLQQDIFEFVENDRHGALVVQAYAGCGKTTTLMESTNHLDPHATVCVGAFNTKIAKEINGKVPLVVKHPKQVTVKTLHGLSYSAVLRAWSRYSPKPDVEGFDREKFLAAGILPAWLGFEERCEVFKLLGLAKKTLARTSDDFEALMGEYDCWPVEIDPAQYVAWVEKMLAKSQQPTSLISFDDMVWLSWALKLRTGQFDHVVIDEAQDMNAAQLYVAKRALRAGGQLLVFGDENQVIYRFNGAHPSGMADITTEFRATKLPLSITYRCPKRIVAEANKYVPELEAHVTAPDGVVRTATLEQMTEAWRPGDFVISRSNAPLVSLAFGARARGERVRLEGRDLGKGLLKLLKQSRTNDLKPFLRWLQTYTEEEAAKLEEAGKGHRVEALHDRREALVALSEGLATVADLQGRIAKVFDDSTAGNPVTLMTVHKAKGLEARRVWLLRDTFRPGKSQEETNLLYVAITRAQHELVYVDDAKGRKKGKGEVTSEEIFRSFIQNVMPEEEFTP